MSARHAPAIVRRYRSPEREETLSVSLSDFNDNEIRAEFAHRKIGEVAQVLNIDDDEDEPAAPAVLVAVSTLRQIRTMALCGQHDAAYKASIDVIRDALGTAL